MNVFLQRLRPRLRGYLRLTWAVIWRTLVKYNETDAEQRAASFAYYAFFSLFPLLLLFTSIGAAFVQRDVAQKKVVEFVSPYFPVQSGTTNMVLTTVQGVVGARRISGIIAFVVLVWSSLRFFQSLVRGVNKAWGTKEYSWWRLPLQNLIVAGIVAGALILGIILPPLIDNVEYYYWADSWTVGLDFAVAKQGFQFCRFLVPPLILFFGFTIFYLVAPQRRTRFREVWLAALLVTLGLGGVQRLFVLYTTNITDFNRVYGALGGVVALLLWIYLSGSLIILGGCLSAAQWEIGMHMTDQSERSTR
jgi:YihY family inner membrane protein